MLVNFAIRKDYLTNKGGDTFQLRKTIEYLEKYKDIHCEIITDPQEINPHADILHIFNLQNLSLAYAMKQAAKKIQGIKIVLSPIIWYFGDASYVNKTMRITHSMNIVRAFKRLSPLLEQYSISKGKDIKKTILEDADIVMPNSIEEGEILRKQYGIDFREVIVPNCVDIQLRESNKELNLPKDFVLEVGRIEPTKNQLSLLESMMNHPEIPLIFVGKQNQRKKYYIDEIKKLAKKRGNTFLIEELPQEDLAEYYKRAKVHVLPSFRESPGLVTLEALFYGCNIVASNSKFCPVHYYKFDKIGFVCNPYSIKSIENAVLDAYRSPKKDVSEEYFDFFSYQNAARIIREAYISLLK
jgi:glycosyltransferase involved in cell wall biosynthesis